MRGKKVSAECWPIYWPVSPGLDFLPDIFAEKSRETHGGRLPPARVQPGNHSTEESWVITNFQTWTLSLQKPWLTVAHTHSTHSTHSREPPEYTHTYRTCQCGLSFTTTREDASRREQTRADASRREQKWACVSQKTGYVDQQESDREEQVSGWKTRRRRELVEAGGRRREEGPLPFCSRERSGNIR